MYIASPFRGTQLSLFSTHPPVNERIAVLRKMAYGSAYQNYDTAYRDVTGRAGVIPASALRETESVPNRTAASPTTLESDLTKAQQHIRIGDFIRQTQGFTFISCPCGITLKMPPNLKTDKVICPRCKKIHPVNTPT
jgi:heat shock protein HtpX